jgi:hypothetical protein
MTEIPKIVSQRLQAVAKLREHPDTNLLGAFIEQSLAKREQVEVLQHLSQCKSCREIISLSAIQPGIAVAVSPAASPRWLSWPVLRWGTAMACVVVVGAAVTLRHRQESRPIAAVIAEGKPAAEIRVPAPDNATENKFPSLQVPDTGANTAVRAKEAVSRAKMAPAEPARGNQAAVSPRPVEMAEARTASSLADMVPGRAKDALAESQSAQAQPAIGASSAMKKNMMTAATSDAFIPETLIPRWTLSSDGTLQRSFDSGRTWQTISVTKQAIFRALSANGLDIWVGGAAGALFHSSDAGQHWAQVRPVVNGKALADDIIGVEFRDALHGKLTSSVEETWITGDAGQTWQKQ